jgi:hypothetical protein
MHSSPGFSRACIPAYSASVPPVVTTASSSELQVSGEWTKGVLLRRGVGRVAVGQCVRTLLSLNLPSTFVSGCFSGG